MMTVTVSFWNKHIWMNLYLRYPEVTHSRTVIIESRCASAHRRSDPSVTTVTTETLTRFHLPCLRHSQQPKYGSQAYYHAASLRGGCGLSPT